MRATGGWVLYDLANTIFSMNIVSFFYSLWVVNVRGGSDSHYALANGLSMTVIFLLSPYLGALTDQARRRMPFLITATLICAGFTFFLERGSLRTSLLLFAFANITYQAGLQFYDALLPTVSTPANRGRIGGMGVSLGYMGSLIGLGTGNALLAGSDSLTLLEQSSRYGTLFGATAALFLMFSLPCFLFVHERPRSDRNFGLQSLGAAARQTLATFSSVHKYPGLARFLIGRVLYTDAVNTLILFMGIYVTAQVGFSTSSAIKVMLTGVICAATGGWAFGPIVDRMGPARALRMVLILWMVVLGWTAAVGFFNLPGWFFWLAPPLAGLALGGTWTADRPLMLQLSPPDRIGEFYGLYGMVGRFAAVLGPFLWALVADTLSLGRPMAVLLLLVFVMASFLILRGVNPEPSR
jgi:UMF1 family MFS transporter